MLGEALKGVDQRIDATQKLRLSIREWQQDREEEIRDLRSDMASMRAELAAMRSENDVLRRCLSPKDKITAADAVTMLRSVR